MKANARKHKKISKNKKKAWKSIDTTELEDFLEEQRAEERTGGFVASKSNSELFFVDKTKDKDITADGYTNRKGTRRLRCFQILEPDPRVPVINKGRQVKRKRLSKKPNLEVAKKVTEKREKKEQALLEKYKQQEAKKLEVQQKEDEIELKKFDIWNVSTPSPPPEQENILDVIVKNPVKAPKWNSSKPSALPAITKPHPGMSYNPCYDDHQDLLGEALKIELRKKKKEDELEQLTVKKSIEIIRREDRPPREKVESEDEEEIPYEELDNTAVNTEITKPKSQKQKKHEHNLKIQRAKKKMLKEKNRRDRDLMRVKKLKKDLNKKDEELLEKRKVKQKLKEKKKFQTKRLGKHKFEEPDLELQLGKEISGSLRNLKPEDNVLSDRYKSFQKRNIIPVSGGLSLPKFRRIKIYEKRRHREIEENAEKC